MLLAVPGMAAAQQKYTLEVKLPFLTQPGKAFMSYQHGDAFVLDSAMMKYGKYNFHGELTEPVLAQFYILPEPAAKRKTTLWNSAIWLEKADIKVTATDSAAVPAVSGGKLNQDYRTLEAEKKPQFLKMGAASERFATATNDERNAPGFMGRHQAIFREAMEESAAKDSLYIITHPASFLSLSILAGNVSARPAAETEKQLNRLSASLRNSEMGRRLHMEIERLKSKEIGGIAPDFTLNDQSGHPVSLHNFHGKYVLLNFWSSTSAKSMAAIPMLKKLNEQFQDQNVVLISISAEGTEGQSKWLTAIKKEQMNWIQLFDQQGGSEQAALLYDALALPYNVLIDPQGRLLAKGASLDNLAQQIKTLSMQGSR